MIAGALNPKKFDRINCTNVLRLACTDNGCTVAISADSNALATAWAWDEAPDA